MMAPLWTFCMPLAISMSPIILLLYLSQSGSMKTILACLLWSMFYQILRLQFIKTTPLFTLLVRPLLLTCKLGYSPDATSLNSCTTLSGFSLMTILSFTRRRLVLPIPLLSLRWRLSIGFQVCFTTTELSCWPKLKRKWRIYLICNPKWWKEMISSQVWLWDLNMKEWTWNIESWIWWTKLMS